MHLCRSFAYIGYCHRDENIKAILADIFSTIFVQFHHVERDIGLLGSRGNRRAIFTVNCKRLLPDEEVYWCSVMAKELYFFLTKSKSDSCVRSKQVRFITIYFFKKKSIRIQVILIDLLSYPYL